MVAKSYAVLTSQNQTVALPAGTFLWKIDVNKATAAGSLAVYNGTSVSDPVIATVDGNVVGTHHYDGVRAGRGLFLSLTGAAGNITVTYS